jgi:RNA polymerase-binding transcription factor DksA
MWQVAKHIDMTAEHPEDDYADIDDKALLIEQCAMLDAIYRELRELNGKEIAEQLEHGYECLVCGSQIQEPELQTHGKRCFGWHDSLDDSQLMGNYERSNE